MRKLARNAAFITWQASEIGLGITCAPRCSGRKLVANGIRQDHLIAAVPERPTNGKFKRALARLLFNPVKQIDYFARSNR